MEESTVSSKPTTTYGHTVHMAIYVAMPRVVRREVNKKHSPYQVVYDYLMAAVNGQNQCYVRNRPGDWP